METLTIGQLALRGGVNLETIRYYEREGLIPPPPRKSSGHRAYSASAVRRLRFIKRAQELGFSLAEIRELLHLRLTRTSSAPTLTQIDAKTRDVEEKIRHLAIANCASGRYRFELQPEQHESEEITVFATRTDTTASGRSDPC